MCECEEHEADAVSRGEPHYPRTLTVGNLEVVVREGLGSMDQETATFVIIEIYDKGELMDSIAVSERSENYKQGVFLLEFARHYFARPRPVGEEI